MAVTQLMGFVEQPLDLCPGRFIPDTGGHAHGHCVLLADVAHIGGALEDDSIRGNA